MPPVDVAVEDSVDYEPSDDEIADYEKYERHRQWERADAALDAMPDPLPHGAARDRVCEILIESVGVIGEPDIKYEQGEFVYSNGSLEIIHRVSPARAINLARRELSEEWLEKYRQVRTRPFMPVTRRLTRPRRRVHGHVARRTRTASRGSPGRLDDPEPALVAAGRRQ
jgi:hypothetical protein